MRRIFHEAELDLARDAQQGMDDFHGRRGPKRRSVDLSAVLKKGRGGDPIVLHGLPVETSPSVVPIFLQGWGWARDSDVAIARVVPTIWLNRLTQC